MFTSSRLGELVRCIHHFYIFSRNVVYGKEKNRKLDFLDDWGFYLHSDDALQRSRNYFGTIFGFYGNGLSRIFRMEKINQKNVNILII